MDISDTNIIFTNEEWASLPVWERREMQQSDYRKRAIDKITIETHNKKKKTSAVEITNENKYVFQKLSLVL